MSHEVSSLSFQWTSTTEFSPRQSFRWSRIHLYSLCVCVQTDRFEDTVTLHIGKHHKRYRILETAFPPTSTPPAGRAAFTQLLWFEIWTDGGEHVWLLDDSPSHLVDFLPDSDRTTEVEQHSAFQRMNKTSHLGEQLSSADLSQEAYLSKMFVSVYKGKEQPVHSHFNRRCRQET